MAIRAEIRWLSRHRRYDQGSDALQEQRPAKALRTAAKDPAARLRLRRRDCGARRDEPTDIQRSPLRQARADLHRLRLAVRRWGRHQAPTAKRAQGALNAVLRKFW